MWARYPRNLALAIYTSDVMIARSKRPMNPEIGNYYLFSDALHKAY